LSKQAKKPSPVLQRKRKESVDPQKNLRSSGREPGRRGAKIGGTLRSAGGREQFNREKKNLSDSG